MHVRRILDYTGKKKEKTYKHLQLSEVSATLISIFSRSFINTMYMYQYTMQYSLEE